MEIYDFIMFKVLTPIGTLVGIVVGIITIIPYVFPKGRHPHTIEKSTIASSDASHNHTQADQTDTLILAEIRKIEKKIEAAISKMRVGRKYFFYGLFFIALDILILLFYKNSPPSGIVLIIVSVVGLLGLYFLWKGISNAFSGFIAYLKSVPS